MIRDTPTWTCTSPTGCLFPRTCAPFSLLSGHSLSPSSETWSTGWRSLPFDPLYIPAHARYVQEIHTPEAAGYATFQWRSSHAHRQLFADQAMPPWTRVLVRFHRLRECMPRFRRSNRHKLSPGPTIARRLADLSSSTDYRPPPYRRKVGVQEEKVARRYPPLCSVVRSCAS